MQEHIPEFESRFGALADEARGLIKMLRSVKTHLAQHAKTDPFYRMTLKRLRDDGIRLASWAEAYSILHGPDARDALLAKCSCAWDAEKERVDLGSP